MDVMTDALAAEFLRYAEHKGRAYSPTYGALARRLAGDDDMLKVAALTRTGPIVDLFFTCVRFLSRRRGDPLAGLMDQPVGDSAELYAAVREFCLRERSALGELLQSRRLQTNEAARAASLVVGLHHVVRAAGEAPVHLVELGSSAGLQLLYPYFDYEFVRGGETIRLDAQQAESGGAPPLIATSVAGDGELPGSIPVTASRSGIDLDPLDATVAEERLWLLSHIVPEETSRRALLEKALRLAAAVGPEIRRGDAVALLEERLTGPGDGIICVYHSHVIGQLGPANRERLREVLTPAVASGRVVVLSLEGGRSAELPPAPAERARQTYAGLRLTDRSGSRLLSLAGSHGKWMQLLN